MHSLKLRSRLTARCHACPFFHQFINSSIHQFINSSIHQFINSSIHQFINSSIHQFLAAESVERPDSIGVEDERFPIGFVWQQSVDIAWAVCASVNEMYVALPCGLYEQVLTKEFGNPLNSGGLSNKYFDLISRRTITEFFAVKALGSGLIARK